MDLATILGLVGSFGVIIGAMILGGGLGAFIDIPSILIVVGGSVCVVMMKCNLGQFFGAISISFKTMFAKVESLEEIIDKAVELADASRKGGLLSLEGADIPNPFMKKGIGLLVDGHDPEVVKSILNKDKGMASERHAAASTMFSQMADVAPAMGMIGTLVGLVQMLSAMDDPKSIGPAMAVALLTTLYGAMIANMLAIPMADKLKLRDAEEVLVRSLIIDALLGIQAGQNPRVIEQMLKNYLPEKKRGVTDE